jgi:hypothetical protein
MKILLKKWKNKKLIQSILEKNFVALIFFFKKQWDGLIVSMKQPIKRQMGPLILSQRLILEPPTAQLPRLSPPTKTTLSCWVSDGFASLSAVDPNIDSTSFKNCDTRN